MTAVLTAGRHRARRAGGVHLCVQSGQGRLPGRVRPAHEARRVVPRRRADVPFSWELLRGKTVIGGRAGGVPEMTLEYVMRQNGVVPGTDAAVDTTVQFNMMAGAFTGGNGDFVTLFERRPPRSRRRARGISSRPSGRKAARSRIRPTSPRRRTSGSTRTWCSAYKRRCACADMDRRARRGRDRRHHRAAVSGHGRVRAHAGRAALQGHRRVERDAGHVAVVP